MLQSLIHYFLHLLAVGAIAWFYEKKSWKQNWLILLATMAVDLDHIFANPIFDPMRCGIAYHPLHSPIAILAYFFGMILSRNKILRLVFIGLVFHMLTDFIDCLWMFSVCGECYTSSQIYKLID